MTLSRQQQTLQTGVKSNCPHVSSRFFFFFAIVDHVERIPYAFLSLFGDNLSEIHDISSNVKGTEGRKNAHMDLTPTGHVVVSFCCFDSCKNMFYIL